MLKWLKNAWPWKSKSMSTEQIIRSWADFHKEITDLPHVTEEKRKPALKKATTRSKTMPLRKGTSDTTRNKNIVKEVKQGKPVKQAVAIGYAVQREAIAKKGGKAAAKKATKK